MSFARFRRNPFPSIHSLSLGLLEKRKHCSLLFTFAVEAAAPAVVRTYWPRWQPWRAGQGCLPTCGWSALTRYAACWALCTGRRLGEDWTWRGYY